MRFYPLFNKACLSAVTLTLVACGSGNTDEVTINNVRPAEVTANANASRIVFNPVDGQLPVPSDLLFSGTTDGTLEPPDEVAERAAGNINYGNPGTALGGLDGWSQQMPLQLTLALADGVTIDATTLPANVLMVEVKPGTTPGPQCTTGACAPEKALTYGVDFVAVPGTNSLAVVPLKPLKPATTYLVGLKNGILDSNGNALLGSALYEQVTKSSEEQSFNNASLAGLQGATNNYEGVIAAATGSDANGFIFSSAWTTSSVGKSLSAIRGLLATAPQVFGLTSAPAITNVTNTGLTVDQVLGVPGTAPLNQADYFTASISLPYFLAVSDADNPTAALDQNWKALCDNGALLAGLTSTDGLTPGPNDTACQGLGLRDFGLDKERHVSQFNPVPMTRSVQNLEVQITLPNNGAPEPFPVVMLMTGITSTKENMLAVSGALSAAGFATVSIDHPLHGSRGFDVDGDGTDEVNASTVSATNYMNLQYLLTSRDNLRQSMADLLGLRLSLNALPLTGGPIAARVNPGKVYFTGISLGGITGTGFLAIANQNDAALPAYQVRAAALAAPGGGIAAFLSESGSFGGLVNASVIAGSGTDLGNELAAFLQTPDASCSGIDPANASPFFACQYRAFLAKQQGEGDTAALAEIQATLGQFIFAAQTVLDPSDPNNYAALASASTAIHLSEAVGNGTTTLPDTVIPNQTQAVLFGGTEPLIKYMGLPSVDSSTVGSGAVRFTEGTHVSLLTPATQAGIAENAMANAAVTAELQSQVAQFFGSENATGNATIVVTDGTYIAPAE